MKQSRLLTVVMMVAMVATSCQQFEESNPPLRGKTRFTASTEPSSRTTMGENYSVVWSEQDEIVMFGVTNAETYSIGNYLLVEGAGTTQGVFEGNLDQEFEHYSAFYPVSMFSGVYSSGAISMELPLSGIVTERNLVDEANPMIAYGTKDKGLQFRNICGILDLKIKGSGSVSSILVLEASSSNPLAGTFKVDPMSGDILECNQRLFNLMVDLDTPLELSETEARSVYVVVPPGEYERLYVETTDLNNVVTSRIATNPVVVERSKITPVTEFEHKRCDVPRLNVSYDADDSNFYTAMVHAVVSGTAEGCYIAALPDNKYQEKVSAGLSDEQIALQLGDRLEQTTSLITYRIATYHLMGQKMHVVALPFDAENNYGAVAKSSFVAKSVPIDSNYSVEVSGEPTITAHSININFATKPTDAVFRATIWSSEDYAKLPSWEPDVVTATNGSWTTLNSKNGTINLLRTDLAPNTEYKLVYRVMNGVSDGVYDDTYTAYSEYKIFTFTTPSYDKSNVTVSLSVEELTEWSATIKLTSSGATQYALYLDTAPLEEGSEHIIHAYGSRISGDVTSHKCEKLVEDTTFYLYAIAYDEKGVYGAQSYIEFTTPKLTAVKDAEYSKFLGSYTFSSQNGSYDNNPRVVTISQDVEGKTFHVKGLLHPTAKERYGITDDTLVAKFFDNMIHVGDAPILGSNNLGYAYVYSTAVDAEDGRFLYYSAISSAYNDGVLTFASLDNPVFNGLIFYPTNDGSYSGQIDCYSNLVLTKREEGGQLEDPIRNPEVGW